MLELIDHPTGPNDADSLSDVSTRSSWSVLSESVEVGSACSTTSLHSYEDVQPMEEKIITTTPSRSTVQASKSAGLVLDKKSIVDVGDQSNEDAAKVLSVEKNAITVQQKRCNKLLNARRCCWLKKANPFHLLFGGLVATFGLFCLLFCTLPKHLAPVPVGEELTYTCPHQASCYFPFDFEEFADMCPCKNEHTGQEDYQDLNYCTQSEVKKTSTTAGVFENLKTNCTEPVNNQKLLTEVVDSNKKEPLRSKSEAVTPVGPAQQLNNKKEKLLPQLSEKKIKNDEEQLKSKKVTSTDTKILTTPEASKPKLNEQLTKVTTETRKSHADDFLRFITQDIEAQCTKATQHKEIPRTQKPLTEVKDLKPKTNHVPKPNIQKQPTLSQKTIVKRFVDFAKFLASIPPKMDYRTVTIIEDLLILAWVMTTYREVQKTSKFLKKEISFRGLFKKMKEVDEINKRQLQVNALKYANYLHEEAVRRAQSNPTVKVAKRKVVKKSPTQKLFDALPFKQANVKKVVKAPKPKTVSSKKSKKIEKGESHDSIDVKLKNDCKKGKVYIEELKKLRTEQRAVLENMKSEKLKIMQDLMKHRAEIQNTLRQYEPKRDEISSSVEAMQTNHQALIKEHQRVLSNYFKKKQEYLNRRLEISNLLHERLLKSSQTSKSESDVNNNNNSNNTAGNNSTDLLDSMINVAIKKIKTKNNVGNNNNNNTNSGGETANNKKSADDKNNLPVGIISCPEVRKLTAPEPNAAPSPSDNQSSAKCEERATDVKQRQTTMCEWMFGRDAYEMKKKDNRVVFVRKEIIKHNIAVAPKCEVSKVVRQTKEKTLVKQNL